MREAGVKARQRKKFKVTTNSNHQQPVCDALRMAIWRRRPGAGLIHHSDRGSQYASKAFRRLLKAHGFKGSMSRKGDCWDNAVVESFFGSLKQEQVQWQRYQTRYEAQQDIMEYITMFYNTQRLHSYLDYMSPCDYEQQLLKITHSITSTNYENN